MAFVIQGPTHAIFHSPASSSLGFLRGFHGVLPPTPKLRKQSQFVRAAVTGPVDDKRKVELVYDLDDKLNKMADEMDKNAGISRLTLFSPCKVYFALHPPNVALNLINKRICPDTRLVAKVGYYSRVIQCSLLFMLLFHSRVDFAD